MKLDGKCMKKFRWDKKYLYWGVTAFLVIVAAVLFYLILVSFPVIGKALGRLIGILSPFIWGLVISYLLCPLTNILERHIFEPLLNSILPDQVKLKAVNYENKKSVKEIRVNTITMY